MYKASQGLSGIADVDTGLKFLNKMTIVPYSATKSRYEGTGTAPGVQKSQWRSVRFASRFGRWRSPPTRLLLAPLPRARRPPAGPSGGRGAARGGS